MNAKKTAALVMAAALMFTAVACGSSKKSDNAGNADASQSEKSSDTTPKSTTTTRSDQSTDDLTGALGALGSSDCLAAFTAYTALYAEIGGFAGGADQSQLDDFEQKTQELKAKIPSEVRDDFQTVADAYQKYAEAVKGLDFSDLLNPDTQNKLKDASAALDDQSVKDAQQRINDYFTQTCGT